MSKYKMLTRAGELKPGFEQAPADQIAINFMTMLQKLVDDVEKGMASFPEGGEWEIVSHQVIKLDNKLVLTVLVRGV